MTCIPEGENVHFKEPGEHWFHRDPHSGDQACVRCGERRLAPGVDDLAVVNAPPYHRAFRWSKDPWIPVEIDKTATIETLCVICQGIERPTKIGARTWLMSQVHVGHDVQIGEDCIICPMTSIAGHVTIGDGVRVDQGVTIRPFITVGDGARLGMGAVVVKDVPAGETWVGNPARRLYGPKQDVEFHLGFPVVA